MAVSVLTILVLYNQGLLLRHKMQNENAADAAVYSVAKLAARHMNMSAYLNRAMVANDILVGQMSGLVSSLHRYEYVDLFVGTFPGYLIPLAPGVTIASTLKPVTLGVSSVFGAIGRPVMKTMPIVGKVSAGWNQALGKFETIFAVATAATQFAAAQAVVKAHANPKQLKQGAGPTVAPVGYFFLASRLAQTYRSGTLETGPFSFNPLETLYKTAAHSPGLSAADKAHIERYLEENEDLISSAVLTLNEKGAGGAIGVQAIKNQVRAAVDPFFESDAEDNSHRYAALVNQSRDDFLLNRANRLGPPAIKSGFTIDLGSDDLGVNLGMLEVKFEASMAIHTDGGSLYRWNPKAPAGTEKYQWTSLDVITGLLNFYAEFQVTVLGVSSPWLPVPIPGLPYIKGLPFPLGGATHQFVDTFGDHLLTGPQWLLGGEPQSNLRSDELPGMPEGYDELAGTMAGLIVELSKPRSSALAKDLAGRVFGGYGKAISVDTPYYIPTLWHLDALGLFGRSAIPTPVPPPYAGLVHSGAGGIPSFWSVDDGLWEQDRTPPYALAVVQGMSGMSTTDNFPTAGSGSANPIRGSIGRNPDAVTKGGHLPAWADLSLQSRSVGIKETKFLTGADKPILSLSSAELYHKRRGTKEKANLFSPFWDARLVENSPVSVMILRGLQNPVAVMRTLVGDDPIGVAMNYLKEASQEMIDQAADQVPPPFNGVVEKLGKKALPFN